ncbi:MAG: hypothetical protein ACRD8W_01940 [Nitrososphaeraceae archaeon]
MTTNKNNKKPRIHHLHKGYTEDGKWTPQHTQAVKMADRIFNSKGPLPERPNIKRPTRKRK